MYVTLTDGDDLVVNATGYEITISATDGKVVVKASGYERAEPHMLILNPEIDSVPAPHLNAISLDRNLTVARLPPGMRGRKTLRLIVWNKDPYSDARTILDIFEGPPLNLIRFFNRRRSDWVKYSDACDARLEVVE